MFCVARPKKPNKNEQNNKAVITFNLKPISGKTKEKKVYFE